jgi:enterochelin esterase family protein
LEAQTKWVAIICLLFCGIARAETQYPFGPDSQRQPNVPQGTVQKFRFTSPRVFEGTERDCAVYIPAQYDGKQPACVMVFQDGMGYLSDKGPWRIPVVFDNLINQKLMPVTIGIFANPGELPCPSAQNPNAKRIDRSFEYDTPDDRYDRFLLEELLPYVEKTYNLNLTRDGNSRAICGSSSGGICAFNAAWQRPNDFRRVISTIGSFTQLHGGGNNLPALIRQMEPAPIRVFLEDGDHDLDNFAGNWPLANKEMSAALALQGYDYQLVFHEGGHSGNHGGPFMPEMLKFIWKDYPKPIAVPQPDMTKPHTMIADIVLPGEDWKESASLPDHLEASNTARTSKSAVTYEVKPSTHRITYGYGDSRSEGTQSIDCTFIQQPSSLTLTPDQSQLIVADKESPNIWIFRIAADRSLSHAQPLYIAHMFPGQSGAGTTSLAMDQDGRLYAATTMGIQIFGPQGGVIAMLRNPTGKPCSNITFGGEGSDTLYAICDDKVYARKLYLGGAKPATKPH